MFHDFDASQHHPAWQSKLVVMLHVLLALPSLDKWGMNKRARKSKDSNPRDILARNLIEPPYTALVIVECLHYMFTSPQDSWTLNLNGVSATTDDQPKGISSSTVPNVTDPSAFVLGNTKPQDFLDTTMAQREDNSITTAYFKETGPEFTRGHDSSTTTENDQKNDDPVEDTFWEWDRERQRFVHTDDLTGEEIVCPEYFD
ncbi:hypothetical protein B0T21DRAFT_346501 [Apiosordaria backusii]|uniref:Uncharacterized protein n=1 Tax=Apiosordaria backusii TaxID=314023 RepID=A0AA40BRY1_9PEZI|nr:hypothetical protein B0T21DRAFT_346501 [Apiosordaria backusii]